jgi:hypothetical protein
MRDGGSGWGAQRPSIQSPIRLSIGGLTAMQGSLARPRSPWVIRAGVRSGHIMPLRTRTAALTAWRRNARAPGIGQMLGKPSPPNGHVHTVRRQQPDSRTAAAGTGHVQHAQAAGKDAATRQIRSSPFTDLTARDPALPLIPSRRGSETLISALRGARAGELTRSRTTGSVM